MQLLRVLNTFTVSAVPVQANLGYAYIYYPILITFAEVLKGLWKKND